MTRGKRDLTPNVTDANGRDLTKSVGTGGGSTGGGGAQGAGGGIFPVYIGLSDQQLDLLEQSYAERVKSVSDGLLLQTRLKGYMDAIELVIDETGIKLDYTGMDRMLAVWSTPSKVSRGGTPGNGEWRMAA
jgi:hypothetical protein